MAVLDRARARVLLVCSLATAGAAAPARGADFEATLRVETDPPLVTEEPLSTHAWFQERARLWQDLWADGKRRVRAAEPDWLRRRSGQATTDAIVAPGQGALCVVLQEDRPDGTEMLTARYTLLDQGAWRTYAGAGLNQAQYFHDASDLPGPTFFTRRNRSTSLGAAAEIGAEMRVSERVLFNADLRWADLDGRAEALRSDYGPVAADNVALGVGVAYQFR